MPKKHQRCGIYKIETPAGSVYVGSSKQIEKRWVDHKVRLKRREHRSARLQSAFEKYGSALTFEVLEECAQADLNEREQFWIVALMAGLNTTPFVNNVWVNPETRARLKAVHESHGWRAERSRIASRPNDRNVAVDCSDGRRFSTMSAAGRAFGTSAAGISHLLTSGGRRTGVRFKLATKAWEPEPPSYKGMRISAAWTPERMADQSRRSKSRVITEAVHQKLRDEQASRKALKTARLVSVQTNLFET